MQIELIVHLEQGEPSAVSWWAESADVPGFSAFADSLADLRTLAHESLRDHLVQPVTFIERLVVDGIALARSGTDVVASRLQLVS